MTTQPATDTVDLDACAKEPIHIPGRIQPHGVLFVLREADMTIIQASGTTANMLDLPPAALLDQPLATVIAEERVAYIRDALLREDVTDNPTYMWTLPLRADGPLFDGVLHRRQGVLLLELEPAAQPAQAPKDFYRAVRTTLTRIQRAPTFEAFCQATADEVQRLTGFDRVMVYQFDEDGHGSVIAEAKIDALDPFLGLHYPATDIPQQARHLYTLNWLRLIPDTSYHPADIVPTLRPDTNAPIDLSYAHLRSVSPIHVEYLKNMGVGASMSLSLVKDGELWGLVACHHNSAKLVPYEIRTACEFLAQAVSLQLAAKQTAAAYEYRMHLRAAEATLVERIAASDSWTHTLAQGEPSILEFIHAGGVAICSQGTATTLGQTPDHAAIARLLAWLGQRSDAEIIATDSLTRDAPALALPADVASGVMALSIAPASGEYIIWFRPEVLQTVNWAGEPTKLVEETGGGVRLSPRKSFALWKETVRGRSLPWLPAEREAALSLRSAIIAIILRRAKELADLNRELARSNDELDEFAYITSHDLKEPLRGIHNYAHFLLEDQLDKLDPAGQDQLHTIVRLTRRMDTLLSSLLHYSRVGRGDMAMRTVSLDDVLHDVLDTLQARIAETQAQIRVPRPLPAIFCDHVRVGEVLQNLIANAMKYNTKPDKWVEIGYLDPPAAEPGARMLSLYVRDNGIGIAPQHHEAIFRMFKRLHARDKYGGGAGVGLAIVKRIVERHGGAVWLESVVGEGTTFFLTLTE